MRKQMITILLALTMCFMCFQLSGCEKQSPKTGATLTVELNHSYAGTRLPINTENPLQSNENYEYMGDYIVTPDFKYRISTGEKESDTLEYLKQQDESHFISMLGAMEMPDGNIMILYATHIIDDNYRILEEERLYAEIYNTEMELLDCYALPDLFGEEITYYSASAIDKDGNLYIQTRDGADEMLSVFDASYHLLGTIGGGDATDIQGFTMFHTADNRIGLEYYTQGIYKKQYGIIDPQTMKITPVRIVPEQEETRGIQHVIVDGCGEYDYFLNLQSGLYGVSGNTKEMIINWSCSDFSADLIQHARVLPDGQILLSCRRYIIQNSVSYQQTELWLLHERSQEAIANTKVLTLAGIELSDDLTEKIQDFNRQSETIRIVPVNYMAKYSMNNEYQTALQQMQQDMTDGIVADVICTDDLPFLSFWSKGLFEDLSGKIRKEDMLTDENYFMNFFASQKYGDAIPTVGFSFHIQTLAGKTEFTDTQDGLNVSEFTALADRMPEDMKLFQNTLKESALYILCEKNISSFVNTADWTCDFENPDFIRILELCNEFEDGSMLTDYVENSGREYRNNQALFCDVNLYEPYRWHSVREGEFGSAEISFTGFPTMQEDSCGAYFIPEYQLAINAQSLYSNEAWEFFMYLLSDTSQENVGQSLPVKRSAMDQQIQDALDYVRDLEGNIIGSARMYFIGSTPVALQNATEQEMQEFVSYVENVTECCYHDETISSIISEESSMYFSGDQSAEDTAKLIQSRVSLYLQEQQ
ncbi:MAG: hypothetical protein K2H82_08900 [Oscillospiraceae bacterium]|nr:hypothetical protein [Oscillospiraceae bacterium]